LKDVEKVATTPLGPDRTVALRELSESSLDVRLSAGKRCLAGHSLTTVVRY